MKKSFKLIVCLFLFILMSTPVMALTEVEKDETSYIIIYDAEGGKNAPKNKEIDSNTITISTKEPTKKGYQFLGWTLNDSNTIYEAGEKITVDKDTTLYAKWKANKYTIKFNGNGSTKGTTKAQTNLKYGTTYTLRTSSYKRTGYTFVGWNTKRDGSGKSFTNKQIVKNLVVTDGKTITLYAQWKKTKYTIDYDLNNGVQNSKNSEYYYITSATKKLYNPTKKGYAFKGWYDINSNNKVEEIKKGSTGNIELEAKWSANKYTIKFNGNGSTKGTTKAQTSLKYGTTYTLRTSSYTRTGYTFVGWNTKRDGSGKSFTNKQKVKNLVVTNGKTITLYAQWKANQYNINLIYDDKTTELYKTFKYDKTYSLPANNYEMNDYAFVGWNTKRDGSGKNYSIGEKVKNLTSKNNGKVNLYAMWGPQKPIISSIENKRYDKVELNFTFDDITEGYEIYRATKKTGTYTKIADISGNSSSYKDETVKSKKTYYYRVVSYIVNESGIKIYSEASDIYKHKTAEKPNLKASLTNPLYKYSYFAYLTVENNGSKPVQFMNFANVYPYKNAYYTSTTGSIFTYKTVDAGTKQTLVFSLEQSRYFSDGAHIAIFFDYDGCSYFASIYEDGDGVFI